MQLNESNVGDFLRQHFDNDQIIALKRLAKVLGISLTVVASMYACAHGGMPAGESESPHWTQEEVNQWQNESKKFGKKKQLKLTESQLRNLISECVHSILTEADDDDYADAVGEWAEGNRLNADRNARFANQNKDYSNGHCSPAYYRSSNVGSKGELKQTFHYPSDRDRNFSMEHGKMRPKPMSNAQMKELGYGH